MNEWWKDKWCPFARCVGGASNRSEEGDARRGSKCLGYDCMAFREGGEHGHYCGLAGVPAGEPE
jgi:hypothetical protein